MRLLPIGKQRDVFLSDVAATAFTSMLAAGTAVVMTRVLAEALGPEEFGAYSLARRLSATIWPVATLSMGTAIPRYVAMAKGQCDRDQSFLSGLILGTIPGFILVVVTLVFFERHLVEMVFHDAGYGPLLRATMGLVVGYLFYSNLYALYRGTGRMIRANAWQIGAIAVGPLLISVIFGTMGRADIIVALSAVLMFCAIVPLGLHSVKALKHSAGNIRLAEPLREMARYGIARVPGGFALGAIFAAAPFLAPYFGSLTEAGYLAAAQAVLAAMRSAVVAFGLVALPRISLLVAEGRQDAVKTVVECMVAFVLHVALFSTIQGALWADEVVWVLLGPAYADAVPIMRVVLISVVPFLSYVMLRSVVDAVEQKAVNTINLFLALGVTLVVGLPCAAVGLGAMGLAIGTTVGLTVLGASTLVFLARRFALGWKVMLPSQVVLLNVAILLVSALAKIGIEASLEGIARFAAAVAVGVIGLVVYAFGVRRARTNWWVVLEQRFQGKRS